MRSMIERVEELLAPALSDAWAQLAACLIHPRAFASFVYARVFAPAEILRSFYNAGLLYGLLFL
jgi:hypothetical protein